jgi:predicted O-methyltransferase YrrM
MTSLLSKLIYKRPRLEAAISELDRNRLKLPIVNPRLLFDDFDKHPVVLTELPSGPWASPIADVVTLAKIALCMRPQRVLEVGSHRGYTTRLLAQHTPATSRVVAFDQDPRHGEAYRDTELAQKIERRVGVVGPAAFAQDERGSYELIFLDADHTYESVKHDTTVLLPLLAPHGLFVWHDYANWGKFSRRNGVPEALQELSAERPVAAIAGSWLAAHCPAWSSGAGAQRLAAARQGAATMLSADDPWTTAHPRG